MPAQTVMQVRRDTAANWSSTNPVLANGEMGYDTTNKLFKVGDGSTAWNSLAVLAQNSATVPAGGGTGDALIKVSATDFDDTWGAYTTYPLTKPASADWQAFQTSSSGGASTIKTNGWEFCQPIRLPYSTTLDRISIYVQTAGGAGSVHRLGIRNDNNGKPGTVLLDAGTVATTTSTSYATITISQALQANTTYWLSCTQQGSPSPGAALRPGAGWLGMNTPQTDQLVASTVGYYATGVTGALGATFTIAGYIYPFGGENSIGFHVRHA